MKATLRDEPRLPEIETVLRDVRYGLRLLARRPAFTLLVVVTLGLGIGAATAIFSIVEAVLLRPLPYKDSSRLVVIWQARPGHFGSSESFDSYKDFENWQHSTRSFEQMEALTWAVPDQTLTWQGKPQPVLALPTTAGMFGMLGVHALRGRTFRPDDLNAACTAVLSYDFWRDKLGSPDDVPGASLTIDGEPCTAIGVTPRDFNFYPKQTEIWTLITPASPYSRDPVRSVVAIFGRLKPGVSLAAAQSELSVRHWETVREAPPESWIAQFVPVVFNLQSEFTYLAGRNLRSALLVLFAAVMLLLLIACVNVANLMMGRAGEREKELAIRLALGSGRGRLIRRLLTESLLLAAFGAGLGTLLALMGIDYFRAANPVELPPGNAVTVDPRVLLFAGLLALGTALLFGLIPAWKVSQSDVDRALKESGRSVTRGALRHRAGRLLVILEAALSLVLLAGAGLLIESVARLSSVFLGYNPDHLLTARIELPKPVYGDSHQQAEFYTKLVADVEALPGVRGAVVSSWLPPDGAGNDALDVKGRLAPTSEVGDVAVDRVSPDFFRVMRIPLLSGRQFDARDAETSSPVAVVNEALAKEYFPGDDPIGQQIKIGVPGKSPWITVVGVVGNIKRTIVFQEMGYVVPPAVYRPASQAPASRMGIIVRSAAAPMTLIPAVQRVVSGLDKGVPVWDFRTANDRLSEFLTLPRFRTVLLSVFASLALLLAAIGIYGVLSQAVTRRTHEIGIRMALGAKQRDVLRLVVAEGLTLAMAGVLLGAGAAWGLTRFLAAFLYGLRPADAATFALVSALLLAVALVASYAPARRAAKTEPIVALRSE